MPANPRPSIRSRLRAGLGPALGGVGPGACALLFAGWCGTVYFGASATGAMVAHAVLVAVGAAGWIVVGRPGRAGGSQAAGARSAADGGWRFDPLELGAAGRWLPPALLVAVALSWWTSPVPRAGRVGLVLLPALLLAPAVFSRGWTEIGAEPGAATRRRRVATLAVSAAVAVVGVWALTSWLVGPTPRPAEPLGHHLLLATLIVTLLPIACLPLGETGRQRDVGRGVAAAAGLSGVVAVLATRSLAGGVALVAEALVAWTLATQLRRRRARPDRTDRREGRPPWLERLAEGRRLRFALSAVALVVVAAAVVVSWGDPSLLARWVYWRGGWAGVLERPVTGLGPGATAWTLAAYLRPIPGINPPSEVVGELHLVPLALAYELGLPGLGLVVATAALFAWRRLRDLGLAGSSASAAGSAASAAGAAASAAGAAASAAGAAAAPALAVAGLTGLAGTLVMGLATADWRVTALPVAVAVAAGAALAGARPGGPVHPAGAVPGGGGGAAGRAPGRWIGILAAAAYVVVAVVVLVPIDRAHRIYQRAEHPNALRRAVELDPSFPLYRFQAVRAEWLAAPARGERAPSKRQIADRSADEAQRAAEAARGVAALWLRAGAAAAISGQPAVSALDFETACGLDPLGAAAPFNLLAVDSPLYRPEALGARALAAEPRLGAALFWRGRPGLLDRSLAALSAAEGIDPGWRQQVVARIREVSGRADGTGVPGGGGVAHVALVVDGSNDTLSLSLPVFRRLPRRVELLPVPVDREAARELAALPPATVLPGTDPRLFPPTCTGTFSPQTLRKTLWKTW